MIISRTENSHSLLPLSYYNLNPLNAFSAGFDWTKWIGSCSICILFTMSPRGISYIVTLGTSTIQFLPHLILLCFHWASALVSFQSRLVPAQFQAWTRIVLAIFFAPVSPPPIPKFSVSLPSSMCRLQYSAAWANLFLSPHSVTCIAPWAWVCGLRHSGNWLPLNWRLSQLFIL